MHKISLNFIKISVTMAMVAIFGFTIPQELVPVQLNWNTHFLGEADENSAFAALTVTTWNYNYKAIVRNGNLHIDFAFKGGVDTERSWVKRDRIRNKQVSRQLLLHEQGHVYINFLLLKESDQKIRNQRYTPSNYKRLIQANANRLSDYYSKMQDRYDEETKHGSDLAAQDKWNDIISAELEKVSE